MEERSAAHKGLTKSLFVLHEIRGKQQIKPKGEAFPGAGLLKVNKSRVFGAVKAS